MSLEALNALKQLNDTRQQGNEVQQGNLEKVQGEVQNQGTSEATPVDSLKLEVVKAEYESALHQAQIERLQTQQAREAKAVVLTGLVAVGATILGAADLITNTIKDIKHAATGGGQFGKDSANQVNDISDPKKMQTFKEGDQSFVFGTNKNGSTTVHGAKTSGNNVTEVGSAEITSNDVKEKAKAMGLLNERGDGLSLKGIEFMKKTGFNAADPTHMTFEALAKADPKAAQELFNTKENDVSIKGSAGFIKAFGNTAGIDTDLTNGIKDKLKSDGKTVSGLDKAGQVGKNFFNGVIQLAEAVVPLLQAYLAAKDKAQNTAEELQMALEKLAANNKKLKQLQALMENAGASGMGKI